jgi:hypothetical protein
LGSLNENIQIIIHSAGSFKALPDYLKYTRVRNWRLVVSSCKSQNQSPSYILTTNPYPLAYGSRLSTDWFRLTRVSPRPPDNIRAKIKKNPYGSTATKKRCTGSGAKAYSTLDPSSGGIGSKLKTNSATFKTVNIPNAEASILPDTKT